MSRSARLIVNGKAASDPSLRDSINEMRNRGFSLEVRVTWEFGDASRYALEAAANEVDVVIAAGGDGTINEVVNGLMGAETDVKTAVAAIPYGTANDFATGCGIPKDPLGALELAVEREPTPIDVGKLNDRYFVNVTSAGFGAEVTASTPPQLKKAMGGAAYALMGVVTAAKMSPYRARVIFPDGREEEDQMIVAAVGNGRLAGGGFAVCPEAMLDDGWLDVMVIHDVAVLEFGTLLDELMNLGQPSSENNKYVSYGRIDSVRVETEQELQMNLDGEPIRGRSFQFGIVPHGLRFVLPSDCPLVSQAKQ